MVSRRGFLAAVLVAPFGPQAAPSALQSMVSGLQRLRVADDIFQRRSLRGSGQALKAGKYTILSYRGDMRRVTWNGAGE